MASPTCLRKGNAAVVLFAASTTKNIFFLHITLSKK